MKLVRPLDIIDVPPQVAKCPECGAGLYVDLEEWETRTGRPTEHGIVTYCAVEEEVDHRMTQDIWQPVRDRVQKWARRRVRVVKGER